MSPSMMRSLSRVLFSAALALIAGCAGESKVAGSPPGADWQKPSIGERMSRASNTMTAMGQQWTEGKSLVEQGKSRAQKGQAMLDEGKDMVRRGEGLQRQAEAYFQEHGGLP